MLMHLLGKTQFQSAPFVINTGIAAGAKIVLEQGFDLTRLLPNAVYLKTTLVQPSLVGNRYEKLLKVIYLKRGKTSYISKHLDFMRLAESAINQIGFELVDGDGNNLAFLNETKSLQINLVFSRERFREIN